MAKILWILMNTEETDILLPDEEIDENPFEKEEESKYEDLQTKRMMNTPFGLAVVDNSMNPFKEMQLFQFHTDFIIDEDIAELIEHTPGVEVLKILTPYRGVVSFGKMFNSTNVRREIEKRIIKKDILHPEIKTQIEELKKELSVHKSWSICVFPNGFADYCFLEDDNSNFDDYNKLINIYQEAVKINSGILIQEPAVEQ